MKLHAQFQLQHLFLVCSLLQPQLCGEQPCCAKLRALLQHSPCIYCTRDHSGQSLALPEGTSSPDSGTHANTNGKSDNGHNNQGKPPSYGWKKKLTGLCVCTSQNKTLCFFFPKRKDTKDEILTTGLRLFIPPGATKTAALKPRFRVPYTSHTHGTPPQTSSSALLHRRGSRPSYSAATMPAEKRGAGESPAGENEPPRPGELRSPGAAATASSGPRSVRPSLTWDGAAPRREELREPPRRRRPWAPGRPPCSRGL